LAQAAWKKQLRQARRVMVAVGLLVMVMQTAMYFREREMLRNQPAGRFRDFSLGDVIEPDPPIVEPKPADEGGNANPVEVAEADPSFVGPPRPTEEDLFVGPPKPAEEDRDASPAEDIPLRPFDPGSADGAEPLADKMLLILSGATVLLGAAFVVL